ncbi:MAG TPA: tetratricopeptide repeat protein, partial [Parvularculaceae bacterium]|nr:tetratricopeptide repeat protein [Parvularculaceae bacterium]
VDPQNPHKRPLGALAADLEKRLADNPADLDGWVELAETYASMNRFADSAKAFESAVGLRPNDAFLRAARGEALTMANNGEIGADAKAEFDRALTIDKKEPRARFYSAEYLYQQGDKDGALKGLVGLVNDADAGAPWLPTVQNELISMAMELHRSLGEAGVTPQAEARLKMMAAQEIADQPVDTAGAAAAPAGAPADMASLEAAVSSGNAAYTDWINLADAYAAKGDKEKANDVLARAEQRYAGAPFVLQQIKAAEARLAGGGASSRPGPSASDIAAAQSMTEDQRQQMIKGMVAQLAAKLENNPNDVEGWEMLGRSYRVLGNLKGSAEAFSHAAALKPTDVATQLSYAQALISEASAANGDIDQQTEGALNAVLKLDANQPFALYYLGLAAKQKNDKQTARGYWEKLTGLLPAGSSDLKNVQDQLKSLGG